MMLMGPSTILVSPLLPWQIHPVTWNRGAGLVVFDPRVLDSVRKDNCPMESHRSSSLNCTILLRRFPALAPRALLCLLSMIDW